MFQFRRKHRKKMESQGKFGKGKTDVYYADDSQSSKCFNEIKPNIHTYLQTYCHA